MKLCYALRRGVFYPSQRDVFGEMPARELRPRYLKLVREAGFEGVEIPAGGWLASKADEQTGIGLWTEDIFVAAIRTGKHMGAGREILPPMPWNYYLNASDEDLKAIFWYLKSLPPIKNVGTDMTSAASSSRTIVAAPRPSDSWPPRLMYSELAKSMSQGVAATLRAMAVSSSP